MTNGKMIKILYAEDDAMQAKTCIDYLKRADDDNVEGDPEETTFMLPMENRPCGCIAGKRPI